MTDRLAVARATAQGLTTFASQASNTPVMLGFDGFVDSIIRVVAKRHDKDHYEPLATIAEFGQRIAAAAGQSANFELVTRQRKLGGNGPIMANALAQIGLPVTYIGALGAPQIDPVFQDFSSRATVHSILDMGATDALEFDDGKLMLGKIEHLGELDYPLILKTIGQEKFTDIIQRSRLLAMLNWTMLPAMGTIFEALIDQILPAVGPDTQAGPRIIFIDLADPAKRTREDLLVALEQIVRMSRQARVILGMNLAESLQVASALDIDVPAQPVEGIEQIATEVRKKLALHAVVVHPRTGAAAAVADERGDVQCSAFQGPFVRNPLLSTGAGDNFNAGFCLGCLADLNIQQALCAGTAASGYYVRNGHSPTLAQLAEFCKQLPDPEN